MASWRIGAKPLSGPMLKCCQLDTWERTSLKFESKFKHFHSIKCIWKLRLQNRGHFVSAFACYTRVYISWDILCSSHSITFHDLPIITNCSPFPVVKYFEESLPPVSTMNKSNWNSFIIKSEQLYFPKQMKPFSTYFHLWCHNKLCWRYVFSASTPLIVCDIIQRYHKANKYNNWTPYMQQ